MLCCCAVLMLRVCSGCACAAAAALAPSLLLLRPLCYCALSAPAPSLLWHAVLTACLQGSLIALVDDRDMARLIASHKSMQWLLLSEAPALVPTSGN